jgi:hypothetical protein
MSFSLNDAIAAVKTTDAFIDREKFEHFWGITPDDKKGGAQRERDRNEDTFAPANVSKGRKNAQQAATERRKISRAKGCR